MSLSKILLASQKTSTVVSDPNFKYVAALVHGNGTNGANNNSFNATDSSSTNYSMTATGSPMAGSFSPYGSNWSVYLSSTSSTYLTYGASTSAALGNNTFTIEAWIRLDNLPTTAGPNGIFCVWQKGRTGTSNFEGAFGVILAADSSGYQLTTQLSGNGTTVANGNSSNMVGFTTGTWYHVAVTYNISTGVATYWFNGNNQGTFNIGITSLFAGTGAAAIGNNNAGANSAWTGGISNVRVVFGSQVYTSNFTPSTSPLTAITGTNFLSCQSNRFIDNSVNAWPITVHGSSAIQRFNPFGNNGTPYSTSSYGGSLFQGTTTNDYLSGGPSITISGDFTIEGWIYYIGTGAYLVSQWLSSAATSSSYIFGVRGNGSGNLFFSYGQGSTTAQLNGSSVSVVANAWNHIAVSRSGSTLRFFVNGVLDTASNTLSGGFNGSAQPQEIGSANGQATTTTQYLSDIRIVNGTALYTATFTPPSAPLAAVTNTKFLFRGIDSTIYDNAIQQDVLSAGNAQISTSQQKFGSGSLSFNGASGTYLAIPNYQIPVWAATNWTIECWVYPLTSGQTGGICIQGTSSSGPHWLYLNAGVLTYQYTTSSNASIAASASPAANSWTHVAIVRNGSTITLYSAGTSVGTSSVGTGSLTSSTVEFLIGASATSGTNQTLNGYIQDFRITFGIARYTANFTPSGPFPNQ